MAAGATREQEWGMRAPGERSGSRAGVRMGRDNEGAGRSGIMQEPNGAMRKPNGSTRGTAERTPAGDGAAERFAGEVRAGAFPAERGVLGGK